MRAPRLLTVFVVSLVATSAGPGNAPLISDLGHARASEDEADVPASPSAGEAEPDSTKPRQLGPKMASLRDRLRRVLAHYEKRKLNTSEHSAWEVMHMVIAYGLKTEVLVGGPRGEKQTAIGLLCYNRTFQGNQILTLENGRPIGVIGVGLQGHHGQLLAILAQANLSREYPMHVAGRWFKVEDLIENEKLTCRSGMELTFKLIAMSHYLTTDTKWKNDAGQEWSISRLIREEIRAPIQGAACGGTHRLMGLSQAVRKRQKEGKPIDGEFARARKYLQDYHRYAFQLQNPDGSFSTQWLEYREDRPDIERRLQTSGHILEWLAFSLSEEELRSPDCVRAVDYLVGLLNRHPDRPWSIGPLGHGLHALALYDERIFRPLDRKEPSKEPAAREETVDDRLPPAREPRSAASEKGPDEQSVLRRSLPTQARRPLPPPAPRPSASAPAMRLQGPRLSSDAGPELISPRGRLK